jgi:hypothetical protein
VRELDLLPTLEEESNCHSIAMADLERSHDASPADPEKATKPSPNITFGDGEAQETMFKHADKHDADEAMKAFAGHEGEVIVITPEMEKNLLRKIDWHLMPVALRQSQHHYWIMLTEYSTDALRRLRSQFS